jgi:hypothetical protein
MHASSSRGGAAMSVHALQNFNCDKFISRKLYPHPMERSMMVELHEPIDK